VAKTIYRLEGKRVFVAGHRGMVGAAVVRRLASENCTIMTASHQDLDLERQANVEAWMSKNRPQVVILAAAKVGGIHVNNIYPADFLYRNLMIEANVIHSAHNNGVEKLLFLGSSCIYPRMAPQPMTEEQLLTGPLEPTNEAYAIAKIAGIKLCESYRRQYGADFISAMPTNLYGPGDNYDLQQGHVVAALIAKTHDAKVRGEKEIVIWGTGRPVREFLFVDDCADALVFLLKNYSAAGFLNVGTGIGISILELAGMIADVTGFAGTHKFDTTKPDGMPHKVMNVSRLSNLGWQAKIPLREGLKRTYMAYAGTLGNHPIPSERS
jgi:GDP-L-fucose synthase